MPNTFFASDHHLGHQGMLKFTRADGVTPLRVFDDVDQMNEHIIAQHNSVVSEKDTIWFLGDVVINRRYLSLIPRFNGRKRLVQGNHDIFKNKDYLNAGFEDFHAFRKFDDFVCTHIPIHLDCLARFKVNVHGHLHSNRIMLPRGYDMRANKLLQSNTVDPRYYSVCVEQLDDYTPISLEDLKVKINASNS